MRIVFISNFMNHHQLPFSYALSRHKDVEYIFVETESLPDEQRSLGYSDFSGLPFVMPYSREIQEIIDDADAVIIGDRPEYVEKRLEHHKLTFRYSERLYKKGTWRRFRPGAYRFVNDRFLKYRDHPDFKVLCASAYTSYDLSLWNFPGNKCLKWGYFPDTGVKEYVQKNNNTVRILWAGRMIPYKQPEYCINLSEELKKNGIEAEIILAGEGPLKKKLEKYSSISCIGALPFLQVYEEMKNSDIFLFTSNRSEGWGAVLNESMQMGCVPVACRQAGATPYLVKDGVNGYIYENGDIKTFTEKVIHLIENNKLRAEMSQNAFRTIEKIWNAGSAAERFLMLAEDRDAVFEDGPLSSASVMNGGGLL